MADTHSKAVRSYNMSRVRGRDTKPEILVRKFLFRGGFRYRLYDKRLPGKPDIVLPKYKTVIFVHGCFWHGHEGCRFFSIPQTRTAWWQDKINKNKANDAKAAAALRGQGWRVIIIWECGLKPEKREETLACLLDVLRQRI